MNNAQRPRLLDAFCGAGGCTKGYQSAGFYVVGVDIEPQPHYCGDEFYQGDAIEYIREHGREFDVIRPEDYTGDAVDEALAAVEDWSYMEQTKARILATRERLTGVLQGLGFDVSPSATNFLWVQHGRLAGARVFEALRDQQILVRRFDQGGLANFLRISMGTDAQIDRLIEVLTELCAP